VFIFLYCVRNTKIVNRSRNTTTKPSYSWHKKNTEFGANNPLNNFQSKDEAVDNLQKPLKKIFVAFSYWEQLTAATNNLLDPIQPLLRLAEDK